MSSLFEFSQIWGERLIVKGPGGSFGLEIPMGVPTAILPPEDDWKRRGPPWARSLWPELHSDLRDWCTARGYDLSIEEGATVVYAR